MDSKQKFPSAGYQAKLAQKSAERRYEDMQLDKLKVRLLHMMQQVKPAPRSLSAA
jgi:hypothetical protein